MDLEGVTIYFLETSREEKEVQGGKELLLKIIIINFLELRRT